jgi:hypothetical protein
VDKGKGIYNEYYILRSILELIIPLRYQQGEQCPVSGEALHARDLMRDEALLTEIALWKLERCLGMHITRWMAASKGEREDSDEERKYIYGEIEEGKW